MTRALALGVSARSAPGKIDRPRFVFGKGEAKKERRKRERREEIERLKEALEASVAEGARLRAETRRAAAALEDARTGPGLSAVRASSPPTPGDVDPASGPEFDAGGCVIGQFSSCDARQIAQQTSMTFLAVVALLLEQELSNAAVEDIRGLVSGGDDGDPFSIFLRIGIPVAFGFLAYFFKALPDMGHSKIKL